MTLKKTALEIIMEKGENAVSTVVTTISLSHGKHAQQRNIKYCCCL